MKVSHRAIARILCLSGALLAAGCVPAPDSTPAPSPAPVQTAPTPTPAPAPAPTPVATTQPQYESWLDAPRTPGDWSYRNEADGSIAHYGQAQTDVRFSIRCNSSARSIILTRAGDAAAMVPMRILTETAERTLNSRPSAGELPYLSVQLQARDPLLDAIALTKGRFAVETPDMPTLYLPAWAEVTRVIEDCR